MSYIRTPENIQKQRERAIQRWCKPGEKEKQSERAKKRWESIGEKEKQSIRAIKRWENLDERKKQSKRLSGKNNPNYGKCGKDSPNYGSKRTPETKQKLKELWQDPILRQKRIEGMKGATRTEETKRNMKIGANKRWEDPEERKRQSERSKKPWRDPVYHKEMCRKIGLGVTGEKNGMYGKKQTPEARQKIREGHENIPLSEEHKRKIRQYYDDPITKEEHLKKVLQAVKNLPNKAEKKLLEFIQQLLPNEYKYTGDGQFILEGKCPDFLNINGQKKLIELFGNYWHSEERTGLTKNKHEKERKRCFSKYGYETLIIWESELKNKEMLKNRLLQFNAYV